MKNLTAPQAVLGGLALIALAIASIHYSSNIVTPTHASEGVQKVAVCTPSGGRCADILWSVNIYGQRLNVLGVGRGNKPKRLKAHLDRRTADTPDI